MQSADYISNSCATHPHKIYCIINKSSTEKLNISKHFRIYNYLCFL